MGARRRSWIVASITQLMRRLLRLIPFHSLGTAVPMLFCIIKQHTMKMRATLPLALMGILAAVQPTIGQVSVLPSHVLQIGDRYRLAVDDNPTVGFGDPGNNMTWDFTDLNNTWDYGIDIMFASDAPLGPVAPGAIAAVTSLNDAAYHYDVDDDELSYTGDTWNENGMPFGMAYEPSRIQLQFPAQVGQQFTSTSRSEYEWYLGMNVGWGFVADSVRRRTHFDYSYEIDGWGSIATPFGVFPCIRVNTLITTIDSIDAKPVGAAAWVMDVDVMDMATREVAYWSPEHSLPVLRLIDQGDWGFVNGAVWIRQEELSTRVPERTSATLFSLHPNPATSYVEVITEYEGRKNYRLMTAEGKLMQQGVLHGLRANIPLEFIESGMYILEVRDGKRVQQLRFMVQ